MNYLDHLRQGGAAVLETHERSRGDLTHVRCQVCNGWHHPAVMLNVSTLDAALTGGAAWACDACWTDWKRRKLPIDAGDDFVMPEEFQHKFFQRLGVATQAELDEYRQQWVLKALRQHRDDIDREIERGNSDASLMTLRNKIQARAGMPLAVSKFAVVANGTDTSVISGIPAGAQVSVDDAAPQTVNDGTVVFAAGNSGRYAVRVVHPDHLPEEIVIDAN